MAKITFPGLIDYEIQLSRLSSGVRDIAGKAIYAGADIVADEIRKGIDTLPEVTGVTKKGLEDSLGISTMRDDNGYLNVRIGFDGYNRDDTPNLMMARIMENGAKIAREIESGTSKTKKHPFVRPAVNRAKKAAEQKMAEVLNEEIEKTMH